MYHTFLAHVLGSQKILRCLVINFFACINSWCYFKLLAYSPTCKGTAPNTRSRVGLVKTHGAWGETRNLYDCHDELSHNTGYAVRRNSRIIFESVDCGFHLADRISHGPISHFAQWCWPWIRAVIYWYDCTEGAKCAERYSRWHKTALQNDLLALPRHFV